MTLDLAAAKRQALTFSFSPEAVTALLENRITLSPHPEWQAQQVIDWSADPFEDKNWRYQLQMLRFTRPLINAGLKGDTRAASRLTEIICSWAQRFSGDRRAKRAPQWADMVDGIRALHICLAAPVILAHRPELNEWLTQLIEEHAQWLMEPSHIGRANHALHQHEGLYVCGAVLKKASYKNVALDRLQALFEEQYDDQGINAEGAIAYHYLNYLVWKRIHTRLQHESDSMPELERRVEAAALALAHSTRPDGTFPSIGDTDGGSAQKVRSPETDYATSLGAKGTPPERTSAVYKSGYAFGRSGWGETERPFDEETYYSISFGKADRIHGHPDGGSITFSSFGTNWVVDPGKLQYQANPQREWLVSREPHNLVHIQGKTPNPSACVSLSQHRSEEDYDEYLFNDDSFHDVELTRRVIYSHQGEYLVVIDTVAAPQPVTATLRWQMGPNLNVTQESNTQLHVRDDSRGSFLTLAFTGTKGDTNVFHGADRADGGWVATGWKETAPAHTVTTTKAGKSFRFITVLCAAKNTQPSITTLRPSVPGSISLKIERAGQSERIVIDKSEVSFPKEPVGESPDAAQHLFALPKAPASGVRPAHTNSTARQKIFKTISAAYSTALQQDDAGREHLAHELHDLGKRHGATDEADLGIAAAIADLTGQRDSDLSAHRGPLVNWNHDFEWRPTYYPLPVHSHVGDLKPELLRNSPAIHTIKSGSLMLPAALDPQKGPVLTVLFHGAIDRSKTRLPIFQRWRHQREIGIGPTLVFADPTLDLAAQLRLGWYLGTEDIDLHRQMANVIDAVATELGAEKCLLTGSSGGGFAALQVGTLIQHEARVLAMSPQTDLRKYVARFSKAAYLAAFGTHTAPAERDKVRRISVTERIVSRAHFPQVEIITNLGDDFHRTHHEQPLIDYYESKGMRRLIQMTEYDLGAGHKTIDNEQYTKVLQRAYNELT